MIPEEESVLRKASNELYTTDRVSPRQRSFIHDKKIDAPDSWIASPSLIASSPMSKIKKTTSWFKNIFLGSVVFFLIAVGISAYMFVGGVNTISSKNVSLEITTRSFVDGGELFPVTVTLVNNNRASLELATLVLAFPEGNQNNPNAVKRITRDIGSLASGATRQESFDISLFGEEGSERALKASLEFRVSGSNAIYSSDSETSLVIRSSPVRLVANIPESIVPNQETTLQFTLAGNGTAVLPNTAFTVVYPSGFTFVRSDPAPSLDSNVWFLGDIPITGQKTISITGTFSGSRNELKTIQASVGIQDTRNERLLSTIYNSISEIIPLTNTFLDIQTKISSNTDAVIPISATSPSSVEISWVNTLDTQINNVEIRARLSGSAYDPLRVQGNAGFFDTASNTVIWTRQQNPSLASLPPGATGQVSFSLNPKSSLIGQNPTIDIAIDIIGFDNSGKRLSAERVDVKKLVINSDINVLARSLYYSGPLQNTGPVPPKVGQETTYTIDWQVTNSRNRVSGLVMTTTLPLGVTWKDVMVPQNEKNNLSYNTITRQITWNIGEMVPGTLTSKTVSFKVSVTPGANQVGSVIDLTSDVVMTGRDEFTKTDITISRRPLSTRLINDTSNVGAEGQVQP